MVQTINSLKNKSKKIRAGFKSLGAKKTTYPQKPSQKILEVFNNQHEDQNYLVPLECNEFTCICPMTGQPDFATLEIIYVPRVKMVESKSLKLYLFSFRNQGEFHEEVINRIFKDLWILLDPKFLRVIGNFSVRGGIAIKPLVLKFAEDVNNKSEVLEELKFIVQNWDNNKK